MRSDTLAVARVAGAEGNVGVAVQGLYGTVVIAADGSYSYAADYGLAATQALAAGVEGTDIFTYAASDGLASDIAVLSATVTGVNDTATIGGVATRAVTEDDAATPVGGGVAHDHRPRLGRGRLRPAGVGARHLR